MSCCLPDIIESGVIDSADKVSSSNEEPRKFRFSRKPNPKTKLSPLEVHRLKQREQYKVMLSSLNELVGVLPQVPSANNTKQTVLTVCTKYIQYLLAIAWDLAGDCYKCEEDMLQCLAWDGFCLNSEVLQLLDFMRPLHFPISGTKSKGDKVRKEQEASSSSDSKEESDEKKMSDAESSEIDSEQRAKTESSFKKFKKENMKACKLKKRKKHNAHKLENLKIVQTPVKSKDRILPCIANGGESPSASLFVLSPHGSNNTVDESLKKCTSDLDEVLLTLPTSWMPQCSLEPIQDNSVSIPEDTCPIPQVAAYCEKESPTFITHALNNSRKKFSSADVHVMGYNNNSLHQGGKRGKSPAVLCVNDRSLIPFERMGHVLSNNEDTSLSRYWYRQEDVGSVEELTESSYLDPLEDTKENLCLPLVINSGYSGSLLTADLPLDLSFKAKEKENEVSTNNETPLSPSSCKTSQAFSPRMFLNFPRKTKETVV